LTLVELLAVIAIIGLLVALLLPAVQRVRESARRTQCGNNLRQVAAATLGFESSEGRLPPGVVDLPLVGTGAPGHTAFTRILPWLEQGPVFQRYRFDLQNRDPLQDSATSSALSVYQCPSDDAAGRQAVHTFNSVRFSRSNFVFSMGSNTMVRNCNGQSVMHTPAVSRGGWDLTNDGPFWMAVIGRPVAAIRDGLANTAFFSEVRSGHSEAFDSSRVWDVRGLWAWHLAGASAYTHRNTPNSSVGDALWANPGQDVSCTAEPRMPCDNTNGAAFDRFHAAARSRHPGGVQVAFLDGHLAFYADVVDANVWRSIGSATGREPVSAE
jgi:prepilin-type processing-associated H-X9-DG protein